MDLYVKVRLRYEKRTYQGKDGWTCYARLPELSFLEHASTRQQAFEAVRARLRELGYMVQTRLASQREHKKMPAKLR